MSNASTTRRIVWLILAAVGLALGAGPVIAQQTTTPPAAPPKQDEEPFWAVGRPKSGPGAQLAPVPAFPIPTPADKLPLARMKVPAGFKVEVFASNVFDARGLREGDKGTVFVSSLFGAGKIYALVDKGGKREVKVIAEKLMLPNGIEFHKGALYVATPKAITRYDGIELPPPPAPEEAPDPARFARGRALTLRHPCGVCHNPDFSGREQMPRLANQREDYLLKSMREYQSGVRLGYGGAMAQELAGLTDQDLIDLAHFLAHHRPTP